MPDTACLHIRVGETDPIRVVEIAGMSVRIGRASYCEVRISDPELADEECKLRKRAGAWQLVPTKATNSLSIDGQPVQAPCSLSFDTPFRVGSHWLTLRPTSSAQPDWESYSSTARTEASSALLEGFRGAPRPEVVRASVDPKITPPPVAPSAGIDHLEGLRTASRPEVARATVEPKVASPPMAPSSGVEHMADWRARPEARVPQPAAKQDQRSWEERWKAAGDRLRAKNTAAAPTPPRAPRPEKPSSASLRSATAYQPSPTPSRTPPPIPPVGSPAERSWNRAEEFATKPATYQPPETKFVPPTPVPTPAVADVSAAAWAPPKAPERVESEFDEFVPRSAYFPSERTNLPSDQPTPVDEWQEDVATSTAVAVEDTVEMEVEVETEPELEPHFEESPVSLNEWTTVESPVVESHPTVVEAPLEPQVSRTLRLLSPEELARFSPPVFAPAPEPKPSPNPRADSLKQSAITIDVPFEETSVAVPPAQSAPIVEEVAPPQNHAPVSEPAPKTTTDESDTPSSDRQARRSSSTRGTSAKTDRAEPRARTSPRQGNGPQNDRGRRGPQPDPSSRKEGAQPRRPGVEAPKFASPTDPDVKQSAQAWPRASDIFAAHQAPAPEVAEATVLRRPVSNLPMPTEVREPAQWRLPLWAGWLPALLFILPVGVITLMLDWTWTLNDQAAGLVSGVLAQNDLSKPLPTELIPHETTWWKSSSATLALWATYFERKAQTAPDQIEAAHAFLESAIKASPIQAQTRLEHERLSNNPEPNMHFVASFGLSRDIVSLAFSGQRCLKAGKKEAALKLYRQALDMASQIKIAHMNTPAFDDDTQVRRYRLPNEDLLGRIIREMASDQSWTYAEWSSALPQSTLIQLVVAHVLTEQGESNGQKVLDSLIDQAKKDASSATSLPPLEAAAEAEAFALRSQWEEAQERYQVAIDTMSDDLIRRSWYVNLADLALRVNDETARVKALEQAKGNQKSDEIAKRAGELLKYSGVRAEQTQPRR